MTDAERFTFAAGLRSIDAETAVASRDDMIRRAARAGATIRALAEVTNLSVGKVNKITRDES